MTRLHRRLATLVMLALMMPLASTRAQAPGDRVRLTFARPTDQPGGRMRREATLLRIDGDSVVVRDGRRERAYAVGALRQLDVRVERRTRRAGALVYGLPSAALGALAGAYAGSRVGGPGECTLEPGGACSSSDLLPTRGTALVFAGGAGLLGAWYGATAGRWGWTRADVPGARVGLHPVRDGIGIRVRLGR